MGDTTEQTLPQAQVKGAGTWLDTVCKALGFSLGTEWSQTRGDSPSPRHAGRGAGSAEAQSCKPWEPGHRDPHTLDSRLRETLGRTAEALSWGRSVLCSALRRSCDLTHGPYRSSLSPQANHWGRPQSPQLPLLGRSESGLQSPEFAAGVQSGRHPVPVRFAQPYTAGVPSHHTELGTAPRESREHGARASTVQSLCFTGHSCRYTL